MHSKRLSAMSGTPDKLAEIVHESGTTSLCAVGVLGPLFTPSPAALPVVASDDSTTAYPSVVVMASTRRRANIEYGTLPDADSELDSDLTTPLHHDTALTRWIRKRVIGSKAARKVQIRRSSSQTQTHFGMEAMRPAKPPSGGLLPFGTLWFLPRLSVS